MIYRLIRYSHQRGHRCARSWTSARTSNRHAHDSFCPIWLPICFDPLAPPFAGNGDAKSTDRPVEDDGLGRMQWKNAVKWECKWWSILTLPCPERSRSMSPFSVPIRRLTPHSAAQSISELKRFLYLRISGVSLDASWDVGVTFTLTVDSRRVGPEPPAPNPKVRKLRCFCCSAYACGGKWEEEEFKLEMEAFEVDEQGVRWRMFAEEEEADLCNKLVILLEERVLQIEFFGEFCREFDVDEASEMVDCGELLLLIITPPTTLPPPWPWPPTPTATPVPAQLLMPLLLLLLAINDFDGVECTDELMAAWYFIDWLIDWFGLRLFLVLVWFGLVVRICN